MAGMSCIESYLEKEGKEGSDVKMIICDLASRGTQGKKHLLACAEKYGVEATVDMVESGEKLLFCPEAELAETDLICLAYHLPGQNGVETARELRRRGFIGDILFYSHDAAHVGDGYDVDALDYIVVDKNMKKNVERAFLKAVCHHNNRAEELMTFKHSNERRSVRIRDILYFEVQHRSVTVHYYQNEQVETFSFNSTLSNLESRLAGKGFLRNHKSYLAAEAYIGKQTFDQIEMVNGDILPVGRKYTKAVVQDLKSVV
jgi:DNA-binding LytR/AlgR family response regulator